MYNRLQEAREGKLNKANCDGKTKNLPRIEGVLNLKELLLNNTLRAKATFSLCELTFRTTAHTAKM